MHIHGNSMNLQAANFYPAGLQSRAAAAERAAEVRKRLLKSAANTEDSADPDATLLVGHWLDQPDNPLPFAHHGGDDFE